MLFLVPFSSISMDQRHDILELARFLTELSVIDYYFVIHRPSSVALAALMNALEEIPDLQLSAREDISRELEKSADLDPAAPAVVECRNRLRLLYAQGGYARPTTETRTETISPVCVSYGCQPQPSSTLPDKSSHSTGDQSSGRF